MAHPQYEWQKQRLKKTGRLPGAGMVSGYGPDGSYSLYLPSPVVQRKIVFQGGKSTVEFSGDLMQFPDIVAAREQVLKVGKVSKPGVIAFADSCLADYSALLLQTQYDFSDADLDLMHSGSKWFEPIIIHALGGTQSIKALSEIDTSIVRRHSVETEEAVTQFLLSATMLKPEGAVEQQPSVAMAEAEEDLLASD